MEDMGDEKRVIQIVETATGLVVSGIDVTGRGARATETIEGGANRNLNHEKYHTRIQPPLPTAKGGVDR